MLRLFVLGASGQFGIRLCSRLADLPMQLVLIGRNERKLDASRRDLLRSHPDAQIDIKSCDIHSQAFRELLKTEKPDFLIHLAGPFQDQDYGIARACLDTGVSYIDMADGRDFVRDFASLDHAAKEKGITLITGASTVPGLSSAVIDHYLKDFLQMESVDYGISAGLKTGLGLATLKAVLSYCGRPYQVLRGGVTTAIYGLGRARHHDYPAPVGRRHMVDCDIPDHDLFPAHYPSLRYMDFGSCIDMPLLDQVLSLMSFCVRKGWIKDWDFLSGLIKPFMDVTKIFGSRHSGFFMELGGQDEDGKSKKLLFEIIARDGSGLEIPVIPVTLMVKRLLRGDKLRAGAYPALGLFSLDEFKEELKPYPISWIERDTTP
ncbi:MAG: saccharopine dehydrogenase NADP-binding domain-containing protein [Alphaproteobacteria bacterium]